MHMGAHRTAHTNHTYTHVSREEQQQGARERCAKSKGGQWGTPRRVAPQDKCAIARGLSRMPTHTAGGLT